MMIDTVCLQRIASGGFDNDGDSAPHHDDDHQKDNTTNSTSSLLSLEDERSCAFSEDVDAQERTNTSSVSSKGSVSFGSVQVREHSRTFSDNFDVMYGLALDWDYSEQDPVPLEPLPPAPTPITTVDDPSKRRKRRSSIKKIMKKLSGKDKKESTKTTERKKTKSLTVNSSFAGHPIGKRCSNSNASPSSSSPLTYQQRNSILREFGFSEEEIARSEQQRAQKQFEHVLEYGIPEHY